jgi:hypothetical protein
LGGLAKVSKIARARKPGTMLQPVNFQGDAPARLPEKKMITPAAIETLHLP